MLIVLKVFITDNIWDELQSIVKDHLANKISFFEPDYQPSQKWYKMKWLKHLNFLYNLFLLDRNLNLSVFLNQWDWA